MQKWKDWAAIGVILLLFPYVAVVLTGKAGMSSDGNEPYTGSYYIIVENGRSSEKMDLETYVTGAALSVLWEDCTGEMMKAQAVLVRTNVVREIQELTKDESVRAAGGIRVVSAGQLTEDYTDPEGQRIRTGEGFDAFYARLAGAVEETRGQILTWQGEPVEAAYHLVSNGKTRNGEELLGEGYDYLKAADSSADLFSEDYLLRKELPEAEWETLLEENGCEPGVDVEICERDVSGYVRRVQVGGQTLDGETFRLKFGLLSADFSIENTENGKLVTTRGVGHGLGMSQYGANALAEEGKGFEEILSCYFQRTEMKKIE